VLTEPEGVLALCAWRTLAHDWRAILVSQVFGRMFDNRLIGHREAMRLVDQMLEVISTLPQSTMRREHEVVYRTIGSWLESNRVEIPQDLPTDTPLRASHAFVARALHRANEANVRGEGAEWLEPFLWNGKLWRQTGGYSFEKGRLSRNLGGVKHVIYMLPALRLALVAVGMTYAQSDPAGRFMRTRDVEAERVSYAQTILSFPKSQARLERALKDLEGPDPGSIRDERVIYTSGHLLLLMGRLAEAEHRVRDALASPMISEPERFTVLYILACVLARSGRADDCREVLEQAIEGNPALAHSLHDDEDLSSVRGQDWFRLLAKKAPAWAGGPSGDAAAAAQG
jgi:tetratricopeptide (TPR) repeat protein